MRSFSPTKVSNAITSENEIGKKPTTISRKGINRSPMMGSPYLATQFRAISATKLMRTGKNKVRMTIGTTIRQSRSVSRISRPTSVSIIRSDARTAARLRSVIATMPYSSTTRR